MRLINSTNYEGKKYSINDVRGFISNESKGLPGGFYGGRVDRLGKTDTEGLYLCMEGMEVIDLIVNDDELIDISDLEVGLEDKTNKELSEMLEAKGIEVPKRATKQELLALLEG